MEIMRVPVHRIHLQTDVVSGFVEVGVRPVLPVKGVSFILERRTFNRSDPTLCR